MTETNRIEFKRELTRELDIEKEVVAFLNYREGGIIYIGVDDAGKPVGVQDIDGDMLKIKDRISMASGRRKPPRKNDFYPENYPENYPKEINHCPKNHTRIFGSTSLCNSAEYGS